MDKNRVYISDAKEAPNDAIIRRGNRGRLYYRTDERGQNNEVGGNHENTLLQDGIDKQEDISEGDVFYDRENETEVVISEVDGGDLHVTTGSHEWIEDGDSAMNNIENGSWVHLPDENRTLENQEMEDDPCWENYEMVGTKVVNGEEVPNCVPNEDAQTERSEKEAWKQEDNPCWDGYEMVGTKVDENGNEVPNCVPKSDVESAVEDMDNPTRKDVRERFNAKQDYDEGLEDACWDGYTAVGMKPDPNGSGKVPNCVPEDEVENAQKLAEKDGVFGKPFEGPNGQGPYDSFSGCVSEMEGKVDSPEGLCATWHHQDTGEWPAEKIRIPDDVPNDTTVKLYTSVSDMPEGETVQVDEKGFFFKLTLEDMASAVYPETIIDEYEYEMPDGEMAGGGVGTESEYTDVVDSLLDEIEDIFMS